MTPFDLAQRFVGEIKERAGIQDHPFILWALELVGLSDQHDETPWCSAFVNAICWILRLPRSKKANARSWLEIGYEIGLERAVVGYDVVILKRGVEPQPGAEVLNAPGHVGFFAGRSGDLIQVLGGNQGNQVSVASFPVAQVLGVRRLK